jgi:uncharacterized protein
VHLAQLWRHPVKSFQGGPLDASVVEGDGLQFDRAFGLIDCSTRKILTARRNPGLLFGRVHVSTTGRVDRPGPSPRSETKETRDAALSAWLSQEVALIPARDTR